MKKSLLLFIVFVILLVLLKTFYTKYCKSKPNGCKSVKVDYENDGLPQEDIDW